MPTVPRGSRAPSFIRKRRAKIKNRGRSPQEPSPGWAGQMRRKPSMAGKTFSDFLRPPGRRRDVDPSWKTACISIEGAPDSTAQRALGEVRDTPLTKFELTV